MNVECAECVALMQRVTSAEVRVLELERDLEVERRRGTIAHELLSAHGRMRAVHRELALAHVIAGGAWRQRIDAQEETQDVYERAAFLWSKESVLRIRYVHVDDVITALVSPGAVRLEESWPGASGLRLVARAIVEGKIRYGAPVDRG